jgi:hypothetical protein
MTKGTLRKQSHPVKSCAAYDGRSYAGSVILGRDGLYTARDARGRVVGRYENLKAATAALPAVLQ